MGEIENQLNILAESLDQKITLLTQIQECNDRQAKAFQTDDGATEADLEAFDREFDEKDRLIDEISRLDDGFETLYDNVAQELKDNRAQYTARIKELQEKISKVTELSVSIQTQEARNKKLAEDYFVRSRSGIRQSRQSSQAAYSYYRNMSGIAYSSSRIMDDKQ